MPILGSTNPPETSKPYFKSLKELDGWKPSGSKSDGILEYVPQAASSFTTGRGKLLVCHDYKGGYTESPFALTYTFNFWSSCDVFVYFSHHRVTIPPPGWITAAHRQGVKMLGTLIFEGGGEEDCLRLLVGKMPSSKTGHVEQPTESFSLPLSPHYARVLAELARERGFDGYLLNFECPLQGKTEQTRALAAWITLLQAEILDKVGPHGETIWYDSVIVTGRLAWQDRLNSLNLPFFLSSSGLFSNYTWRPDYPTLTAQYFLSLDSVLTGDAPEHQHHVSRKTLQDIYMGVDVWGRGSHGGGGLGCYKAITHIAPESLGLSVALFGQAWTWESEQDKEGWNWDKWWEYESKLWVGPVKGEVEVPEAPRRPNEPECLHGPFLPINSFFTRHSPPDPYDLPFHTTFSPGVGRAWFVQGVKAFESKNGWTDVDKQTSVGDLVWPRPILSWEDDREDELPEASSHLIMDDAWNGGSCLQLTLTDKGSEAELAAYRCIWIPVQSLTITPGRPYQATTIYKVKAPQDGIDLEVGLAVKSLSADGKAEAIDVTVNVEEDLTTDWRKLSIEFNAPFEHGTTAAIGLIVAIVSEDPSKPLEVSFLLGQLNVFPTVPENVRSEHDALLLWADFQRDSTTSSSTSLSGTLLWEVAASLPHLSTLRIISAEDPISAWHLQPSSGTWFPSFVYFNIYAQPYTDEYTVGKADDAVWIGTSGLNAGRNTFAMVQENLPSSYALGSIKKVRLYIQGLSDRGDILKWNRCVYVDVSI
ncbi:glycoside hydrolase family 85 protein [Crucibulum laeve]|uniref:Glycoside hydrolase family 85 protein n=1 Tax=Crucibulum laeve TaxID=68775 RepID=A0A5C3LRV9_9AGAR|nr:glycoside hydrolase family 85 protein [Crucibulum laeve]